MIFLHQKMLDTRRNQSTVTQLLDICQKIYKGIDYQKEVRMVFLDASKAFDRVWHAGLLFKLKQLDIYVNQSLGG